MKLQLQWVPQSQFAGYFAARDLPTQAVRFGLHYVTKDGQLASVIDARRLGCDELALITYDSYGKPHTRKLSLCGNLRIRFLRPEERYAITGDMLS